MNLHFFFISLILVYWKGLTCQLVIFTILLVPVRRVCAIYSIFSILYNTVESLTSSSVAGVLRISVRFSPLWNRITSTIILFVLKNHKIKLACNNNNNNNNWYFYIAPFPPIMFKSALESYSQLNSFRNSNVFSCFLKFCTLSAALMLSGSSFQRRGA